MENQPLKVQHVRRMDSMSGKLLLKAATYMAVKRRICKQVILFIHIPFFLVRNLLKFGQKLVKKRHVSPTELLSLQMDKFNDLVQVKKT